MDPKEPSCGSNHDRSGSRGGNSPNFRYHQTASDCIYLRRPSRGLRRRRKLRIALLLCPAAALGGVEIVAEDLLENNKQMGGPLRVDLLPGRHPRLEISRILARSTSLDLSSWVLAAFGLARRMVRSAILL